jgi:multicomponent Na+:H+ antiporter subunit F
MIETLIYQAVAVFLLLNIGAGLIRIWRGPTPADRLLAVQLFGTTGTAILLLLALAQDDESLKNIALVFALLASVLGVVFTRYGQEQKADAGTTEAARELE